MTIPCCHLHTHSRNSFKDALNGVDELVDRAADLGQPGFGLTDHGVVFGAPDLFKHTKRRGIKGVIGMECYEAVPHAFNMERDGEIFKIKWADLNGRDRYYHLTLWVLNVKGWENLCALHSRSWTRDYFPTQRGKPLLDRASLEKHNEGIAVGLGCMASRTNQLLSRGLDAEAYERAKWYAEVFEGRCWTEIHNVLPEQQALIRPQRQIAKRLGLPTVWTGDVHYVDQEDGRENGPHHMLIQARAFKKADTERTTERSDDGFGQWYGSDGFYLKDSQAALDGGGITTADLTETLAILDRVDFEFDKLTKPKPPIAAVPALGEDPSFDAWLAMAS